MIAFCPAGHACKVHDPEPDDPPGLVACHVCVQWFDPFKAAKRDAEPVPDDEIEIT